MADHADWPTDIHAVFKKVNVRKGGHVPDTGTSALIYAVARRTRDHRRGATSEAEGLVGARRTLAA